MSEENRVEFEQSDRETAQLGFGKGGVPWALMLFYLAFLAFFAWYALEYQLPDFMEEGPLTPPEAVESPQ
jgi:hypothetical protein